MGWWSMNKETGGIGNINIDKNGIELVMGDEPADIMGDAIGKIVKSYKEEWHREPTLLELKGCFKFVTSCYK